jgi:ribokinase
VSARASGRGNGPELVLLGSLTLDNVLSASGEALPRNASGNVVYAALGARLWHGSLGIVSRAGRDYNEALLERLAGLGIAVDGVRRLDRPHGMNCAFWYRPDGSRERAFPPEVLSRIAAAEQPRFDDYTTHGTEHRFRIWSDFAPEPCDVPAGWWRSVRAVHGAAMPVERHLAMTRAVRALDHRVDLQVDSPWYDARDLTLPLAKDLLPLLDRLLPSEADLLVEAPEEAPMRSAARLLGLGVPVLVVKRGEHGATILRADGTLLANIPVVPVTPVDPTGAGDAFCGGFLAGFHNTGNLIEAALRGTVSASFAVEAAGPAGLFAATADEAQRRLERLRAITSQCNKESTA